MVYRNEKILYSYISTLIQQSTHAAIHLTYQKPAAAIWQGG